MSYIFLLPLIIYCVFLHVVVGEFKQCNADKYPLQVFCIKEVESK